jgi:hypothetical protein
MTPTKFLAGVIVPRAGVMPNLKSPEAMCLLLAIAGQESAWANRLQEPIAYARGFWQCEHNGAVLSVLTSTDTQATIYEVLDSLCIPKGIDTVFEAIAWNDTLAYCVARLALYQDPAALPAIGDQAGSWEYYLRVWRPGAPAPERWATVYPQCMALFPPPAAV